MPAPRKLITRLFILIRFCQVDLHTMIPPPPMLQKINVVRWCTREVKRGSFTSSPPASSCMAKQLKLIWNAFWVLVLLLAEKPNNQLDRPTRRRITLVINCQTPQIDSLFPAARC